MFNAYDLLSEFIQIVTCHALELRTNSATSWHGLRNKLREKGAFYEEQPDQQDLRHEFPIPLFYIERYQNFDSLFNIEIKYFLTVKVSCSILFPLIYYRTSYRFNLISEQLHKLLGNQTIQLDACSHMRNSSVQHVETWGQWETKSSLLREDTMSYLKLSMIAASPAGRKEWRSDSISLARHPQ